MSSDLSLPLFSISISNRDLDVVLASIEVSHPALAADIDMWRSFGHLIIIDGKRMFERVAALEQAMKAGGFRDEDIFARIAERIGWLTHDLGVAPVSISQPVLRLGDRMEPPIEQLVVGLGVEWSSVRYLLGVLLGELHRLEGLALAEAANIDQAGILDLDTGDVPIEAIVRTVDAIVLGNAGRAFPPMALGFEAFELTEVQQFVKLKELLAAIV